MDTTTQPRWLETYRIKVHDAVALEVQEAVYLAEKLDRERAERSHAKRQAFIDSLSDLLGSQNADELLSSIQPGRDSAGKETFTIDSGPYRFVYANKERYDGANNRHVPALGVLLERAMPDIYVKLLEAYLDDGYYNRPDTFRFQARESLPVKTPGGLVQAMIALDNKYNEAHRAAEAEEERRATAQLAELQKPSTVVDTPREYTNVESEAQYFLENLLSDIKHGKDLDAGQTQVMGLAASLAIPF